MKTAVLSAGLLAILTLPLHASSVSKTYTYFFIGGTTLEEIEAELDRKGPQLQTTGARHPGATRMEFLTRITYGERGSFCSVMEATVTVKANMILPRWNRRNRADSDTKFVWDTLSADIKRHEEAHVTIARNHARELEEALMSITNFVGCERAKAKGEAETARILEKHDREQARFDRIEGISFEKRIIALMRNRMEQMKNSR